MKNSFNFYNFTHYLRASRRDEDGGLTIFGLYIFLATVIIAGIAVDMTHLISERTKLQITADLAAHAALYNRDSMSAEEARDQAINVVATSMPDSRFGEVMTREDIVFGNYNYATSQFSSDDTSRSAVLVSLRRHASNNNAVASFLMQFVGVDQWNLSSQAVFVTYRPACLREGFVAEGIVDMQSNNGFSNGFCIHSNTHVSLNQNNYFEPGTVVSMPDIDDLDMPRSGFEKNDGLETALREGRFHIRVLSQLDDIVYDLLNYGGEHTPDYITDSRVYTQRGKKISPSDFSPGTINHFRTVTESHWKLAPILIW